MGFQPSYRTEAQIYTKYLLKEKPDAKLAILYQNDDFGKDYPAGVRDVLGANWNKTVVKSITYEVTDPTINSQIVSLKSPAPTRCWSPRPRNSPPRRSGRCTT